MFLKNKKTQILISCNFPRFKNNDDLEYLENSLENALQKQVGRCYDVRVVSGNKDQVTIVGSGNKLKERAIKILVFKKIKEFK